eukprot:SAG11_NODE_35533_length_266_cov_0.616766_1_plen_78_part_10
MGLIAIHKYCSRDAARSSVHSACRKAQYSMAQQSAVQRSAALQPAASQCSTVAALPVQCSAVCRLAAPALRKGWLAGG